MNMNLMDFVFVVYGPFIVTWRSSIIDVGHNERGGNESSHAEHYNNNAISGKVHL